MHYSTASDNSVPSSITLFVALYLIILAFFIILTKDLSFDEFKKTVAMHSIYRTFGHPKTQEIYFGVIDEGKIDEFHAELETIFKEDAEYIMSPDNTKFTLKFKKDFLYFEDETYFKPEVLERIVQFRDVIRRWNTRDKPEFTVGISLSNYEADKQRLSYFQNRFGNIKFNAGMHIDNESSLEIIVERTGSER